MDAVCWKQGSKVKSSLPCFPLSLHEPSGGGSREPLLNPPPSASLSHGHGALRGECCPPCTPPLWFGAMCGVRGCLSVGLGWLKGCSDGPQNLSWSPQNASAWGWGIAQHYDLFLSANSSC